jgi:hypothetical protein
LRIQVVGIELAGLVQRGDQVRARLAVDARRGQQGARFIGDFLAFQGARNQRVAFDLGVVVEHEQRQLLVESGPVALAAQFQQPVVAQAVDDGLAFVAFEEIADFGRRGILQARFQPIIINVGRNGIVAQARGVEIRFGRIILAYRVAQQQEGSSSRRLSASSAWANEVKATTRAPAIHFEAEINVQLS